MLTILLSNDDGVHAQGLQILAQSLSQIAKIIVIAPNADCSGSSHSLTLNRSLNVNTFSNGYNSVNGTPTDCVHLAVTGFLHQEPDMVVAGINVGPNMGDDVLYSGTVAAAMEGRFLGFPSIAISSLGRMEEHFNCAAKVALDIVQHLQCNPLPSDTILNVNVPALSYEELSGWKITRLGKRHKAEPIIKQKDPRGNDIYWIGLNGPESGDEEGTDFHAVRNGFVSLTPLHTDLTHYNAMSILQQWITHKT